MFQFWKAGCLLSTIISVVLTFLLFSGANIVGQQVDIDEGKYIPAHKLSTEHLQSLWEPDGNLCGKREGQEWGPPLLVIRTDNHLEKSKCRLDMILTLVDGLRGYMDVEVLHDTTGTVPSGLEKANMSEKYTGNDIRRIRLEEIKNSVEEYFQQPVNYYSAYQIYQEYPKTRFPILNQNKRKDVTNQVSEEEEEAIVEWFSRKFRDKAKSSEMFGHQYLKQGSKMFLNFFIHEPSLVLFYKSLCYRNKPLPKHIWVLEDDVAFLGPRPVQFWKYFRNKEEFDDVDHMAVYSPLGELNGDFFSWNVDGSNFPDWPLHKWEHIERYSASMLYNVDKALKHGYAVHGEYFSSSICAKADGCKMYDLRDSGFIAKHPRYWASGTPIFLETYSALGNCRSSTRAQTCNGSSFCDCCSEDWHNRWVHGVKDWCLLLNETGRLQNISQAGHYCTF